MTMQSPYLCKGEPAFDESRSWFADMPNPWGALGWKDHLFEFMTLWNGSLAAPVPWRKGLEPYRTQEAQFTFVPTTRDQPWDYGHQFIKADDGSVLQGLEGNSPVAWFEHVVQGVRVLETVFCHVPGGKRLKRGDEPLFAWVRFEIMQVERHVHVPEALDLWTHIGALHLSTTMAAGQNLTVQWPSPAYAHRLALVDGRYVMQSDGLCRMAATECASVRFEVPKKGPNQENWLRTDMKCRKGESIILVVPFIPVSPEVMENELTLGWESAKKETLAFWKREARNKARISMPDAFATRSFGVLPWQIQTIAERRPQTGEYALNTGAKHYEGIWATPFAMTNTWGLDYLGYHEEARNYLELFRVHQGEVAPPSDALAPHDGFLTTPAMFETIKWISDHGAILYASAMHGLLTRDRDFIHDWMPCWERALDWIRVQRAHSKRPYVPGILPPGQATDDYQRAQFVWNDGWAYLGLRAAVALFKCIGRRDARRWEREAEDYRISFLRAFRQASRRTHAFRTLSGREYPFVPTNLNRPLAAVNGEPFYLDTGPLFAFYCGLVPADDPLADSVLAFFREGPNVPLFRPESAFAQQPVLFHEISSCEPCYSWNIGVSLERGDRERFAEGLFSLLSGGQSPRNFWDIETRNGIYTLTAVKPLAAHLLRHAMIHERDGGIELLRLPPRDWLRDEGLRLENMATWYGPMSVHAWMERKSRLKVEAKLPDRDPYAHVLLNIPPFGKIDRIVINETNFKPASSIHMKPPEKGILKAVVEYTA